MSKVTINDFSQKVYNLCSQIPNGNVSTYQHIAQFLSASPRAVGQVLKKNPYLSEIVPCHRVIATNYFIGGFRGQWGAGKEVADKKNKLAAEKVFFDEKGYLLKGLRELIMFKNFHE